MFRKASVVTMLALTATLTLSLTGCGGREQQAEARQEQAAAAEQEQDGETSDTPAASTRSAEVEITPDTEWYTQNPGADIFNISTAAELAGLAQIFNGTWGGTPEQDNFLGRTIVFTADGRPTAPPASGDAEILNLTTVVTNTALGIGARGGFMPRIYYREYHRYITNDSYNIDTLVEYTPGGALPRHPRSERDLTVSERHKIYLYMVDHDRNTIQVMYTASGEMLINADQAFIQSVRAGDEVFTVTNPRRAITVSSPDQFLSKPISAYDELMNRLMAIKDLYSEAGDIDNITINADGDVVFDKIMQVINVARNAGYANIAINIGSRVSPAQPLQRSEVRAGFSTDIDAILSGVRGQ
jgi:hypothetical protein